MMMVSRSANDSTCPRSASGAAIRSSSAAAIASRSGDVAIEPAAVRGWGRAVVMGGVPPAWRPRSPGPCGPRTSRGSRV